MRSQYQSYTQFYCHTHSIGKLCAKCGERKAREEKLEQIYQDYFETSEKIKAKLPGASKFWAVVLIILGFFTLVGGGGGVSLVYFVPAMSLILYALGKRKKAQMAVEEIDKAKPGFAEFYRKWKEAEDKQSREYLMGEIVGMLGAGVAGAAKGVGEGIKIQMEADRKLREGTPRDVERAIRSLEKTIAEKK